MSSDKMLHKLQVKKLKLDPMRDKWWERYFRGYEACMPADLRRNMANIFLKDPGEESTSDCDSNQDASETKN